LVIVSKDADFSDRIMANSPPPRVVHLRFGNLRRNEYHTLLARWWPQIESLLKTHKLVNVYADRLEGIGRNQSYHSLKSLLNNTKGRLYGSGRSRQPRMLSGLTAPPSAKSRRLGIASGDFSVFEDYGFD
jgi:hypothetical protein